MCHLAGGSEEDERLVEISLSRAAFFQPLQSELGADGKTILRRVAVVAATLERPVEIDVHLEDDAAESPRANRIAGARGAEGRLPRDDLTKPR